MRILFIICRFLSLGWLVLVWELVLAWEHTTNFKSVQEIPSGDTDEDVQEIPSGDTDEDAFLSYFSRMLESNNTTIGSTTTNSVTEIPTSTTSTTTVNPILGVEDGTTTTTFLTVVTTPEPSSTTSSSTTLNTNSTTNGTAVDAYERVRDTSGSDGEEILKFIVKYLPVFAAFIVTGIIAFYCYTQYYGRQSGGGRYSRDSFEDDDSSLSQVGPVVVGHGDAEMTNIVSGNQADSNNILLNRNSGNNNLNSSGNNIPFVSGENVNQGNTGNGVLGGNGIGVLGGNGIGGFNQSNHKAFNHRRSDSQEQMLSNAERSTFGQNATTIRGSLQQSTGSIGQGGTIAAGLSGRLKDARNSYRGSNRFQAEIERSSSYLTNQSAHSRNLALNGADVGAGVGQQSYSQSYSSASGIPFGCGTASGTTGTQPYSQQLSMGTQPYSSSQAGNQSLYSSTYSSVQARGGFSNGRSLASMVASPDMAAGIPRREPGNISQIDFSLHDTTDLSTSPSPVSTQNRSNKGLMESREDGGGISHGRAKERHSFSYNNTSSSGSSQGHYNFNSAPGGMPAGAPGGMPTSNYKNSYSSNDGNYSNISGATPYAQQHQAQQNQKQYSQYNSGQQGNPQHRTPRQNQEQNPPVVVGKFNGMEPR